MLGENEAIVEKKYSLKSETENERQTTREFRKKI